MLTNRIIIRCSAIFIVFALPAVADENVTILNSTTVITSNWDRYYFDFPENGVGDIFNSKDVSNLRAFKLFSQNGSVVESSRGIGLGFYAQEEKKRFTFIPPDDSASDQEKIADTYTFRLIARGEPVQEDGVDWQYYYLCASHEADEECIHGKFSKPRIWKMAKGDIFKLKKSY